MGKTESEIRLSVATKAIEKEYGHVVKWLGEAAEVKRETISTGSIGLDNAIGNGGLERGLIAEIFGENGSGKSFLAYNIIKQACLKGLKCAIVDAENSLDPKLLINIGLPENQVLIVEGAPTGEANLSIADNLMATGDFAVVMIDSVAALVPGARMESTYDQQTIGLHARLMSAGLQKILPVAKKTNTLLIFINQIRNKVGGYGNPQTTTGGEALPFYASYRIEVIGSPRQKSRRLVDEGSGEVYGHSATFRVVKNKRQAPYREAELNLVYGLGYDTTEELIQMGADTGLITKSGAWLYYKDFKWQGKDNAKLDINGSEVLLNELKAAVKAVMSGKAVPMNLDENEPEVEEDAKPTRQGRKARAQ